MYKVMISLLGGRPLPNVLAALHLVPNRMYIIASRDSLGKGGSYDKAIQALPDNLKPHTRISVDPYSLSANIQECEKIANQHRDDQVIIVSASEPKVMGFGAYDVAKRLREQGCNISMCYLSRDGIIWVVGESDEESQPEPAKINLKQYFSAYGWNVEIKREVQDKKFKDLVSLLIEHLPESHRLLHTMRSSDRGKGKRTIKCAKHLSDAEFSILQEIEQLQIVSNVRRSDAETKWTINGDEEARFLLTGDWLEYYVYLTAKGLIKGQDQPLFDECGWGVEDQSGKGEIDFVGILGGQIVIASCKTENGIKRTWFEELHSKVDQLGKGMCSAILISTVSNRQDGGDLQQYEKWAGERQIVLMMAEDLPDLSDSLKNIATGNKAGEPKGTPYYPRI